MLRWASTKLRLILPRQLPFLNGMRAFEAAARLGGFAAAGAELHVSPAAISRMVGLLEQRLGLALFERRANRLALTTAGAAYRDGLGRLLDELEALTGRIRAEAGRQIVTIDAGPSFATHWLIPRLAGFQRLHPGIEVRLAFRGARAAFDEGCTARIRLGAGPLPPGLVAEPLFPATLRPVCAPAMAARLVTPGALSPGEMLRVVHAPEDWPDWLAAQGLPALPARGPVFDFYGQAQQAAADGLGVAMGLSPYIDAGLGDGRLVAPFPGTVRKLDGWFLIHRPGRLREAGFQAFRDWMLAAAAA